MVEMGFVNERPMTAPQVSMQYDIVNTGSGQEGPAGEGTVEDDRSMQLTPRITMEGNAIKDQKILPSERFDVDRLYTHGPRSAAPRS